MKRLFVLVLMMCWLAPAFAFDTLRTQHFVFYAGPDGQKAAVYLAQSADTILQNMAAKLDASQGSLALASDFHNGMLSLIIPFGIWGVITVVWFLFAGLGVLWRNAKYCDPDLKLVSTFLFTLYFWEFLTFMSCFGGLQIAGELASFIGYLGMSIALNNGVCQAAHEKKEELPSNIPFRMLPRPRPVFQR